MWCQNGLESIIEINASQIEEEFLNKTANKLSGSDQLSVEYTSEISRVIRSLILRSQANSDHKYEIYTITTTDMNKDLIEEIFNYEPQVIVDLIREKGQKLYANRITTLTII